MDAEHLLRVYRAAVDAGVRVWVDGGRLLNADGETEWNYVMVDDYGRRVDVHVFCYDSSGSPEYGIAYPAGPLTGSGVIDGLRVECVAAEWMLRFKSSYPPQEKYPTPEGCARERRLN